jgi:hypothetical protein
MKKEFLNEHIFKKLKDIVCEIGEYNYNKTFSPPDNVAKKAKEALAQIEIADYTIKNTNQGSGKEKAVELSKKTTQNVEQMKKMASFFSVNSATVSRIKQQGGPKTDEERHVMQAWDLHGGEYGNQWVKKELENFHKENQKTKDNLRKAGGAGKNKGMGIFTKNTLDTNKHRIHR